MKNKLVTLVGLLLFTLALNAQIAVTCAAAAAAMPTQDGAVTADTYIVTGYITHTNGTISRGQQTFYMDDMKGTQKTLQGYWCTLPAGETNPLNVGDKITLTGKIMNYRNTPEIKNGDVAILERSVVAIDTIDASVCTALEVGEALSAGDYTTDIFRVYGRVKGTVQVNSSGRYTFEMACGEDIFKPYSCNVEEGVELGQGDSVVVIGKLYNYNGTIEISGGKIELIEKNQEEEENPNKTYDFEKDGCYYNILSLSDLTVELTCRGDEDDYDNNTIATYSGDFRVPETVDYSNRTFTVTQIHPAAFINCHLGTLTIPATVQSITGYFKVFGDCQDLVIEDSENPLTIPSDCMIGQVYNSVYLGRNLEGIGSSIVYNSTYNANTNSYSGGLYSSITFGNNVTELGRICSKCPNLTSVTLPSSIKYLHGTFEYCENLTSVTGEGVEVLDDAFSSSGIQTINMPNLKIIKGAFQNCNSLQTINIPEGVVWMGNTYEDYDKVFTNSTSLTSVSIPATVVSLSNKSFSGCTSLNTISVAHTTPISIAENTFDMLTYLNATLKVPVGALTAYANAPVWQNFLNIAEDPSISSELVSVFVPGESYYSEVIYSYGTLDINIPEPKTKFDTNNMGDYAYYDGYLVPSGTTITMTVTSNKNYQLDSLVVNGVDVTAQMQNNTYSYVVSSSTILKIRPYYSYHYTPEPEPELVYVRIKQATGGQIEFPKYQRTEFSFYIVPEEGWLIHSVTSNGTDITSQVESDGMLALYVEEDLNIVITFVESQLSSAPEIDASKVRVYGANDLIYVTGAAEKDIRIVNEAGLQILSQKANQDSNYFVVDKGHVYLVQVGGTTYKVAL